MHIIYIIIYLENTNLMRIIIILIVKKTVKTANDSHGGCILLLFNLRRQTSKGPSQHVLKVPRETGEKPRSRIGAEGPNKIHRKIMNLEIVQLYRH